MIPIRDLNPTRNTPWVTWTLLLLCGLVFVWQAVLPVGADRDFVFSYGLVPRRLMFGHDPAAIVTLFTSMFMHGGLMHIIGNLWFLRMFGDNVEDNMGPVRFALFYVLCGLAAAAAQIAMNPASGVPMVGASGAIAGVLAAYLVLFPHARVVALVPIFIFIQFMEIPAFVFIALWFALQFFSGVGSLGAAGGGVAYWAHIGGFVAGLALVFLFRTPKPPAPRIAFERPQMPWRSDRGW
ncbi:MAG: rhomboid family intramembrane serine protease [Deltaproteobacteria bacterium]|nr:rhomboid family intramembrane serine protease [Deltaproteobacteria bacterium]